jgi:hypothetical protein
MATYQNSSVGVQFSYPQSWSVNLDPQHNGQTPTIYYQIESNNGDNLSVASFSYHSKAFYPGVSDSAKLQKYFDYWLAYANESDLHLAVVQNVTPTTLGGQPARTAVYAYDIVGYAPSTPGTEPERHPIQALWVVTIKGDTVYDIVCQASPSYYAGLSADYMQILNSFTFI